MDQSHANLPIAIIGMAARVPGSKDLNDYWRLIRDGGSAVQELPPEVLDRELYYNPEKGIQGKSYTTLGGLAPRMPFDHASYDLPDSLVASTDEAHLNLCDVAAEALRHARMNPFALKERNVGVYIGHAGGSRLAGNLVYGSLIEETTHYLYELPALQGMPREQIASVVSDVVADVRSRYPHRDENGGPDLAANVAAALISRAFRLDGPYMALDAACASSLQAMMLGIRALQQGRIGMAIAGGASYCKSDSLVLFSHAQSVSATGSRPFDADADGLISAEGYITLVLKTLPRAIADGDPICAVIRGLGISSDGKGKSLWAPRKEGQIVAIQRAYADRLDPNRVQYVEAHATSTQVGDATELTALAEALEGRLRPGTKLPLGSVKANVGHTLETAGMAGLVKVVLAMQNQVIPPAINVENLNPKIDWENAPFYVPRAPQPWPAQADGSPRRAAVNAFGIGGLNIHVVVDEYIPTAPAQIYFSPDAKLNPAAALAKSPAPIDADEPIAIVGMGTILPGAYTLDAFWDLLVSGRDPKSDASPKRWNTALSYRPGTKELYRTPTIRGGFTTDYEYDWRRHKVPPKQLKNANPLQFMLLDAAEQALRHAGYGERPYDRTKVGVVVGTIFGGDFANQLQMGLRLPEFTQTLSAHLQRRGLPAEQIERIAEEYRSTLLEHMPALADETGSFTSSTLASKITKTFDLMGGAIALDAGPGSGLAAVGAAMDILRSGGCDMMICAAGQRNMDLITFEGLAAGGRLSSGNVRSPFAAGSDGIVPGEGVAVVILRRLSDAKRDGDTVHAVIRGLGAATDFANRNHATQQAIVRALAASKLDPADVTILETSTSGVFEEDQAEVTTLAETFSPGRRQPLVVDTVIDQIGHTGGATGIVSLVKSAMTLQHKLLPGGLGIDAPAETIGSHASVLRAVAKSEPLVEGANLPPVVIGVSAGSGSGLTFHALVDRGLPQAAKKPATSAAPMTVAASTNAAMSHAWRIVRLGAGSLAELGARVATAVSRSNDLFSAAPYAFTSLDQARLAIVAPDEADFAKKLTLAAEQMHKPEAIGYLDGQGVFVRTLGAVKPRIALMFPGQNSQYVGMLRELTDEFAPAAAALRHADRAMAEAGFVSFAELAWHDTGLLGKDNWTTQASILLASTILSRSLAALGIEPDLVAGHSFGENPALVAAGAWTLEQAIRTVRSRSQILDDCPIRGSMMATTAPSELTEQAVREIGGPVFVANFNAPKQTVVAGEATRVQQVIDWLSQRKQKSRMLAVPCPFHTPLMAEITPTFRELLAAAAISAPRIPLVSSVTNRYAADPDDIRDNLANQLVAPVNYVGLVRKIAAEAPTVFVEVGPQQTLSGLHPRILEGADASFVAADNPRRPGVGQLYCVRAMLECCGAIESESQVATPVVQAAAAPHVPAAGKGRILHFDATVRRKEKQHASSAAPVEIAPAPVNVPVVTSAPLVGFAKPQAIGPIVAAAPAPVAPVAAPAPAPVAAAISAATVEKLANLESFLINFVVEETGYPPEIVELDADLEGDLGIDSIKKAQLFGELAEHFPIAPGEGMSLDDYTTLRHVKEFIEASMGSGAAVTTLAPVAKSQAVEPVAAELSAPIAPVAVPLAAPAVNLPTASLEKLANLESFLINFVVEETGYPPEIVELDADLEGDLGIDSIKKAQLFGELAEHFPIAPGEGMSLDDYTTLRHVKDFIEASMGGGGASANVAAAPVVEAVPQHVAAPAMSAVAAPTAPIAIPVAAPAVNLPTASLEKLANLESFLINFVVEETGYPPEIVELDADLEGDLGIDSIKKAQLFGELAEHFPIAPGEGMSLDDYTTLRHVKEFIEAAMGVNGTAQSAPTQTPVDVPAPAHIAAPVAHANGKSNGAATHDSSIAPAYANGNGHHHSNGHANGNGHGANHSPNHAGRTDSPYDRGWQHGQRHRAEIHQALRWLADTAGSAAEIGSRRARLERHPSSEQLDELRGMADGADVPLENMLAHQGLLTDEALRGRFVASQPASGNGHQHRRNGNGHHTNGNGHSHGNGHSNGNGHSHDNGHTVAAKQPVAAAKVAAPATASSAAVVEAAPLLPVSQRTMRRLMLRTTEAPLAAGAVRPLQLAGPVLIVGQNRRATELQTLLVNAGATIHLLDATDADAAAQQVESLWQSAPIPHLFVMTGCADAAGAASIDFAAQLPGCGEILPTFAICQKWIELVEQANLLPRATLAAVTTLGGDFGFQNQAANTLGGGIAGLLKAIRRECDGLRVKVIDTPSDESPAAVAQSLVTELASTAPEAEVAYRGGRRYLVQAIATPAPAANRTAPAGGAWVFTGGARGITAHVARELGRRFGLKLHLVGSSPASTIDEAWLDLDEAQLEALKPGIMRQARETGQQPLDAWNQVRRSVEIQRNLRNLRREGLTATYHACDVADEAALARVLDEVRRQDGPIQGIVHGAGVEIPCRIAKKKRGGVVATIASKVDGTRNLMNLTRRDPLRYFIAFGSNSGRFGGHGQADYSLASEMQCKLVGWFRHVRPDVAACGFLWPSWDEVGMAVRPEIKVGLKRAGLSFLAPAEGIAHLVDELSAGLPEAEVLVLDRPHLLDLDGIMSRSGAPPAAVATNAMPTNVMPSGAKSTTAAANSRVAEFPLIDEFVPGAAAGEFIARVTLDPDVDVFLTNHKFNGKPFLPAVVSMELVAEAANLAAPGKVVAAVCDVELVSGFTVLPGRPQAAEVRVRLAGNEARCELVAACYSSDGKLIEPERVYVTARVELADRLPELKYEPPGEPVFGYSPYIYPDEFVMYHGAPLRCLTSTAYQRDGGRSTLVAPPPRELAGTRSGERWIVPSALIDGSLVGCATYSYAMLERIVELPKGFGAVRLGRTPAAGEACTLRLFYRGESASGIVYDFVLFGADGTPVVAVEGFDSTRLEGGK